MNPTARLGRSCLHRLIWASVPRGLVEMVGLCTWLLVSACHGQQDVADEPVQLLVEFTTRLDAAALAGLASDYDLRLIKVMPSSGIGVFSVRAGVDVAALVKRLAHEPVVKNAELDQRVSSKERR